MLNCTTLYCIVLNCTTLYCRSLDTLPPDLARAVEGGRIPGEIVRRLAIVEQSGLLRYLLRFGGFRERLLADDLFLTKVAIECGVGVCTKVSTALALFLFFSFLLRLPFFSCSSAMLSCSILLNEFTQEEVNGSTVQVETALLKRDSCVLSCALVQVVVLSFFLARVVRAGCVQTSAELERRRGAFFAEFDFVIADVVSHRCAWDEPNSVSTKLMV